MKQVLVLFSSALAVFGAVAGSSAPAGGEGWAKRAYLDPAFVDFAYATNVVKAQVRLNGWSEFDCWNDARKRTGQPVRKSQMGMSSFVFRGRVKVPAAGRYRFRYTAVPPKDERMKNSAHFLAVNGRHVREFPEGFDLKAGEEVRLELFFRANGRYAQPITETAGRGDGGDRPPENAHLSGFWDDEPSFRAAQAFGCGHRKRFSCQQNNCSSVNNY